MFKKKFCSKICPEGFSSSLQPTCSNYFFSAHSHLLGTTVGDVHVISSQRKGERILFLTLGIDHLGTLAYFKQNTRDVF